MLLAVGPARSGKGTIARVQRALLGEDSVAGPTLASIGTNFGLQPLLDKTLAIVSDARLSGRMDSSLLVERLLSISGEDALSINRKFLESITRQLQSRIMILTNEIPRLADSSGALANRFVILRMTNSFLGREDTLLTDKLYGELPAILQWAVVGWRDLRECGRFIVPDTSTAILRDMEDLSSPVTKFVREYCTIDPAAEIEKQHLYHAYASWCTGIENIRPPSDSSFGKHLRAAVGAGIRDGKLTRADHKRATSYVGITLRRDILSGVSP